MEKPKLALRAWGKLGSIERVSPFGSGHINDTYLVEGAGGRYILQRINTNTFQDVDGLMQNIRLVTEFITEQTRQAGGDVGRESMRVIPCDDGRLYHRDEEGSCWRVLSYIEGSVCLQKARNEQDLFECAAAFGRFQRQLGDFDASRLTETIPRFHDTPKRYQDFEQAVLAAHRRMFDDILARREAAPSLVPVTMSTIPLVRMSRRLEGVAVMTRSDDHRRLADSVGMTGDWCRRGPAYEIPFGALHCAQIKNLLAAGRDISADDEMWNVTRVIPPCAVTGQAAGTAAALGSDFIATDITELQRLLAADGVKLHLTEGECEGYEPL